MCGPNLPSAILNPHLARSDFLMKTKSSDVSTTVAASSNSTSDQNAFSAVDTEFELGVWLAGLESFLDSGSSLFTERMGGRSRDWTNEFRLVHSALLLCLKHAQDLMSVGHAPRSVSPDELDDRAPFSAQHGLQLGRPPGRHPRVGLQQPVAEVLETAMDPLPHGAL